jgi:hypothetical protein|tara:strand:- start:306 stop:851 length:546 start_codon:yes stop_codon:yes gene_type:complete
MIKKFDIKPPIWPKELTFEEFKKLNPHINENQVVNLYNQYLAKYLNELRLQKIHFLQSKQTQLVSEINSFQDKMFNNINQTLDGVAGSYGGGGFDTKNGIGNYAIGTYLYGNNLPPRHPDLKHVAYAVDGGYDRFTVGDTDPSEPGMGTNYGGSWRSVSDGGYHTDDGVGEDKATDAGPNP